MKIAGVGDLHITDKKPECRTDNYFETVLRKFSWILSICKESGVDLLIQPGDFFNSFRTPYEVASKIVYLLLFGRYRIPIVGVYGQHDLRFHSLDTSNTPLNLLESAGVFTRLHPHRPYTITSDQEHVCIWGCSWGEAPNIVVEPESVNILAIHRMIIDAEKVWPGQTDYTLAMHLLRDTKCDLIVAGDNHNSFVSQHVGRKLINCGSMMRSNVDQVHHIPHFYIYDTLTGKLDKKTIPHEHFSDVATVTKNDYKKAASKELDDFISRIESTVDISMDFKRNVLAVMEEMDADKHLVTCVSSIFNAVESVKELEEKELLTRYNIAIDEEKANGSGTGATTIGKIKRFHRGRQEGEGPVRGGEENLDAESE